MPEKSKYSLLENCSNLWCCLSISSSLLLILLKATCRTFKVFCVTASWLVSSSFFITSESILDVFSNNFFHMSLYRCNKTFCCKSILSCNVKKDAIKFSLIIFSNSLLVRICDAMIKRKVVTLLKISFSFLNVSIESICTIFFCLIKSSCTERKQVQKYFLKLASWFFIFFEMSLTVLL